MRKEDRLIAAAASAAKHKAGKIIDATAGVAAATATMAGVEVHKAADLAKDASAKLAATGEKVKASGDRLLKLAK